MRFSTLSELLQQRAKQNAEGIAYTFLPNGEGMEHSITYGELDLKARAVAAYLQICTRPGERALLLFPSGLEYIIALMGCFYSGIIAVPAYPPKPVRGSHRNARIQSIIKDAQPSVVMTLAAGLCRAKQNIAAYSAARQIRWVATDIVDESCHSAWKDPGVSGDDIAFLQYTSGSTSIPKGVMLSHSNILHNERMIEMAWGQHASSTVVGWLPLYHDMGLIGNVLHPLYLGARSILMPSAAFLQKPVRWLQAISRYRGKTSGGPNFAYDLCVRKVTAPEKEKLDLSAWTVAFNGAEPVRKETLERFTTAFARCRFRLSTFYPCYGLAEANLMVSGGATSDKPVIRRVDARALEKGRVEEGLETEAPTRDFVGCGQPVVETRVVIVNPETCNPVENGKLGEIWVSGPAVARGYWNQPEATEMLFRARLRDGTEGEYLRTRDLGFIHNGELFIAGRLQDMIIIRGQNHHPEDIEWTVQQACTTVAIGAVAAFSIDEEEEQRVVVLMEVDHHGRLDGQEVATSVRRAVAEQHDIQVQAIGLVKARTLAKTSSGKIQRHICKQEYLSRSLELLYHSVLACSSSELPPVTLSREDLVGASESESRALLEVYLEGHVRRLAWLGEADVTAPLIGLGLDSIKVVQLKLIIEKELAVSLELEVLLGGASIRDIARSLVKQIREGQEMIVLPIRRADRSTRLPLSFAQQRLWFLAQLEPASVAYNEVGALRLIGKLDVSALERSLREIVRRHEVLRTSFRLEGGEPLQEISGRWEIDLPVRNLADLTGDRRIQAARRLAAQQANRPFDLSVGPLLRAELLQLDEQDHVLVMVMHRIVCDGWSKGVLISELNVLYEAYSRGAPSPLEELQLQYADFAVWQRQCLERDVLQQQLAYWREQLAGLEPLELPTDHPRPRVASHRSGIVPFTISAELRSQLVEMSQREGVTLYMTLLAALQLLLGRYSEQQDVAIGTDVANRNRGETEGMIGFFVNTLVLRTDLKGNPSFRELLKRVRKVALAAYAHQDLPFERLVEALFPQRDLSRSPLFQVSLVMQNELKEELRLGDLRIEALGVKAGQAKFDLTVTIEESRKGLAGAVEYATDLFEASTIQRLIEDLQVVLRRVVSNPEEPIAEIEGQSLAGMRG